MATTALLLIDMQNDYFPGGKWELEGIERASRHCAALLHSARKRDLPVIHVQHESTRRDAPFFLPGSDGMRIHSSVRPLETETVIVKHAINSFLGTPLRSVLDGYGVKRLIIAGAMSHLCVEGAARAANDLGYECLVAHDACATRAVEFGDVKVSAAQLHASAMSTLQFAYAALVSTEQVVQGSML